MFFFPMIAVLFYLLFFAVSFALVVKILRRYKISHPLLVTTLTLVTLLAVAFIAWMQCYRADENTSIAQSLMGFLIVVMPYLLLIATLIVLTAWVALWRSPARTLLMTALGLTTLLVTVFIVWAQYGIFTDKSSTAGIAFIFMPFYTLLATAILASAAWTLTYVVFFIIETICRTDRRVTNLLVTVIAALGLIFYGWLLGRHLNQQWRLSQAGSPQTSAEKLSRLQSQALKTNNTRVLQKLAANPDLSDADLRILFAAAVNDKNFDVLGALAANPRLPAADLARLYELTKDQPSYRGYDTWRGMADNRHTPPEILQELAGMENNSHVRLCVATNPSTPVATLIKLTADPGDLVRTYVTGNPNLPAEHLLSLLNDHDATVRSYAKNNAKRRGLLIEPPDPALARMRELGQLVAGGDRVALDEIHAQYKILYADIDREKDWQRMAANLKIMNTAFDIIGDTAADPGSASFKALQRAGREPDLQDFAVHAYGRAAAAGNREALDALLRYDRYGWRLESVCGAIKYPADRGNTAAVDFLIAVLQNPHYRDLEKTASGGLRGAAQLGNEKAVQALVEHDRRVIEKIKSRKFEKPADMTSPYF